MTHQRNAVLGIAGLILMSLVLVAAPTHKLPPEPVLLEAPVPLQESTTADAGAMLARYVPGKLPSPGPNQKRTGQCDPDRSEEELNGGCWVQTRTPPPCPRGKQWEHEGRCWIPVAPAKPGPTSGEPRPSGVAEP